MFSTLNTHSIKTFRTGIQLPVLASLLCFFLTAIQANEKLLLLNLAGSWKFSIGDNMEWLKSDLDDASWESVKVPSAWEDQGFYGYDGYGWYRTTFIANKDMKNRDLVLSLGYISDVDQVYLNGNLIGFSGSFPPEFSSALQAKRKYPIPENFILPGKNVIAVRVYNHQLEGGIVSGDIGIVSFTTAKLDISLCGLWNFKTGDNTLWKGLSYQDNHWKKIVMPGNWENQGYKGYDGVCWYRQRVFISNEYSSQRMVLLLGKTDEANQVFLNGKLLDNNNEGLRPKEKMSEDNNSRKLRVYTIPDNILLPDKINVIAIRVNDKLHVGGISEGPVGLMRYASYLRLIKEINEANEN